MLTQEQRARAGASSRAPEVCCHPGPGILATIGGDAFAPGFNQTSQRRRSLYIESHDVFGKVEQMNCFAIKKLFEDKFAVGVEVDIEATKHRQVVQVAIDATAAIDDVSWKIDSVI